MAQALTKANDDPASGGVGDLIKSMAIAILFVAAMICLTGAFGAFLVECRLATEILRFGTGKSRSLETRALRRENS